MAATTAPDDPPARMPSVAASDRQPARRLPIRHGDDLVDLALAQSPLAQFPLARFPLAQQLRPPPGTEAGEVAGSGRPTEDHRPDGVDGHHVQGGEGRPEAAGEPEDDPVVLTGTTRQSRGRSRSARISPAVP